jgi:hypothetical protein
MRRRIIERRKGQALILATLALFAMCGLVGLAVDLGWSFYVRKSAQAAADAAALAAVTEALSIVGRGDFVCGSSVTCTGDDSAAAAYRCTVDVTDAEGDGDNLNDGCLYARQRPQGSGYYGFVEGANTGRAQTVRLNANVGAAPTPLNMSTIYWVRARVGERIPQLFSAVFGNLWGTSTARATAAVMEIQLEGSLRLINREDDRMPMNIPGNPNPIGVNIWIQSAGMPPGNPSATCPDDPLATLCAEGGILLASSRHGEDSKNWAGLAGGGTRVWGSYTYTRADNTVDLSGGSVWEVTPMVDGEDFMSLDPTRGLAQPPPPNLAQAPDRPGFEGGVILGYATQAEADANPLPSGSYYAVTTKDGTTVATGDPLTVTGYVTFAASGDGRAFGNYVFYGGIRAGGGGATAKFGDGRYVFAGAKQKSAKDAGYLLDASSNMSLLDFDAGYGPTAGQGKILIFTDAHYPDLQVPAAITGVLGLRDSLLQGKVSMQAGATGNVQVNLHGLNPDAGMITDSALAKYNAFLVWQDRRNSYVEYYDGTGYIACGDFAPSCVKDNDMKIADGMSINPDWDSPLFQIQASDQVHLYGVIYQPRGAWAELTGGNGYSGPMQLITGGILVKGSSRIRLQKLDHTFTERLAALIE